MELGRATGRHGMACKFMRMSTSPFVRRKVSWIPLAPYRQRLLNENVRHNNDDVSDWELTGLLLVSRSE